MKKLILPAFLLLMACKPKPGIITINVDHSRQMVKVTGLPEITLNGIRRDSISLAAWQSLFPVTAMPADTDMKELQRPMPGKYQVTGQDITFKPDTLFIPGQTYFARYYRYDKEISALDIALHKGTLGKANYTELVFKY